MNRPAVFLDKDGTLVENVPYNVDPAKVRLAPGAGNALRSLQRGGFALVVVSNQSGVARGMFGEGALEAVRYRLEWLLSMEGVQLDGFYYCPHHPLGAVAEYRRPCRCRKPAPGMLRRASADLDIDLERSWMVGDILDDIEAGRMAGCRALLVDNGGETEWVLTPDREPEAIVAGLEAAAHYVLESLGFPGQLAEAA